MTTVTGAGWRKPRIILFTVISGLAVIVTVGSPILTWFPVVRVSAVLWAVLLTACWTVRPWRWTDAQWARAGAWTPSDRTVAIACAFLFAVLWWLVYSRFQAGGIDAVDFTVYFDRPLYQTSLGRPLFVESTDDLRFAHLTHLAVHAYWILLPLSGLYLIHPSPLWLLTLSVAAVTMSAFYVYRVVERVGAGAPLATAAALVVAFDGNTARVLNYGFHPEILYAWFVPWAIYAAMRGARGEFLAAVLACLLVKEDAVFPLLGLSAALALTLARTMDRRDRVIFLLAPPTLALLNLAVFYLWVVPYLSPHGQVMYSYFWATAGSTPFQAAAWLINHPVVVVRGALTSGFFTLVLVSHWYLPVLGWRWIAGLLPLVFVYGISDSEQIRGFGIYYVAPLIPFLAIGTAMGAWTLSSWMWRSSVAPLMAAAIVVASALSTGLGYSLRPWKSELRAVPQALALLGSYDRILVQGGLYPHAGYDERVQLLTSHDMSAADGVHAVLLLATRGSTYPLRQYQWQCLAALPPLTPMPEGLLAVALTHDARRCMDRHVESASAVVE